MNSMNSMEFHEFHEFDGSRRVALIDKAFRVSRRFSRDLERMGRGGWLLLIKHFVCRGDLAGTWNGWVAAGGSY